MSLATEGPRPALSRVPDDPGVGLAELGWVTRREEERLRSEGAFGDALDLSDVDAFDEEAWRRVVLWVDP